jgi:hypothetical protein
LIGGVLLIVFLLLLPGASPAGVSVSHLLSSPSIPLHPSAPPYAFDGAYANYSLAYYTTGGAVTYVSNFTIKHVDAAHQTFQVTSTYNSYFAPFGTTDNATFQLPIPFPAASPSQLQQFGEGTPGGVYGGDEVVQGVKVTVPAGTFITYEVVAPISTVWFDTLTGVEVQERGLMLGEGNGGEVGLELASTNIRAVPQASPLTLYFTLGSVGWIAACAVFALAWSYRSEKRALLSPATRYSTDAYPGASDKRVFLFRPPARVSHADFGKSEIYGCGWLYRPSVGPAWTEDQVHGKLR